MDLSEAFILGHCSGLFLALILFLVIWMLQRQVARRTVRRVLDEFLQEQAAERCAVPADEATADEEAEASPTRRYLPRL